jgi:hypothetical protein
MPSSMLSHFSPYPTSVSFHNKIPMRSLIFANRFCHSMSVHLSFIILLVLLIFSCWLCQIYASPGLCLLSVSLPNSQLLNCSSAIHNTLLRNIHSPYAKFSLPCPSYCLFLSLIWPLPFATNLGIHNIFVQNLPWVLSVSFHPFYTPHISIQYINLDLHNIS